MEYLSPCRLCFDGSGEDIFSISEIICFVNETIKLADIINICVQLKIDENDSLPQAICSSCKLNLIQFYEFRQKCYETDAVLRIKSEDVNFNELSDKTDIIVHSDENIVFSDEDVVDSKRDIIEYSDIKIEIVDISDIIPQNVTKKKSVIVKRPKEAKIHKCDVCSKICKTSSHLRAHREIHSDHAKYLCVSCGETFKSKQCLLSHSIRHSGLYKCKTCDKEYSSTSQLDGHMRMHTGERPFKCSICNAKFAANATLKVHMRRHTGVRPFQCRYCDKSFIVSHQRISHELVHGDKTNRPFKCIICSKDFQKKQLYVQHQKLHLDERQYKCEYCDKEFVYRRNWKVHLRTHTGEKPYNCPLCSKAFAQRVCMRTHVDKAHPDQAVKLKEQNYNNTSS